MKLVVSSDYHLDHVTHGVARFDEIRTAVFRTVSVAIEKRADAWIFLGDAMNPDSGSCVFRCVEVLVEIAKRMKIAGIPTIFMAGNHDVVEDGSGKTTLSPLRPLADGEKIFLIEGPEAFAISDQRFVCFPFTASSHGYDPVAWAKERMSPGAITLSHLAVPGIQPGEETTEMPRGREVVFPVKETGQAQARLQGHYHRQQSFDPGGGPPVLVPGSLARLTFGEENHDPSFLVLEV